MKTAAVMVMLGTVLVPALTAQQAFNWKGKLASGKTIEIVNINGEIRASGIAAGGEVAVSASKRARHDDPDDVEIKVVEHEDGVTICAVYPSRRSDRPNECRPGGRGRNNNDDNDVEVDFSIKVPAGVKFVGHSVNGAVEAEGLTADAKVYSVNGDVRVSSAGVVEASTVNGSIVASMGRADWVDELEFETVNGSVTLTLPAEVNAELEIGTVNGSIETDFPITVSGKMSPQQLRGRLGKGGRELEVKTVNGSIRLRKGSG